MNKRSIALLVISIIVGMLLGSLLGELVAFVCPAGVVKDFFLKSITPECGPFTVNLLVVTFTLGIGFKLNIASVLGVFIAVYYLRWYT
jgi:ABC-type antimicrobial peptide transport system permease subunit